MDNKLYLNLGSGDLPIEGALNIDIVKNEWTDEVVDLSTFPWKWKDDSVDGIYMIHSLEHFADCFAVLSECKRILKKGAFLYIQVPHSSSCSALGNIGHYRAFSYDAFNDFLCRPYYIFKQRSFECKINRIFWWHLPVNHSHPFVKFKVDKPLSSRPFLYRLLIIPARIFIQKAIDFSPHAFERFWCYLIGGADEMVWKGIKL